MTEQIADLNGLCALPVCVAMCVDHVDVDEHCVTVLSSSGVCQAFSAVKIVQLWSSICILLYVPTIENRQPANHKPSVYTKEFHQNCLQNVTIKGVLLEIDNGNRGVCNS